MIDVSNRTKLAVAAVVIGRNEGAKLDQSIRSVQSAGLPLVYSDSGSKDQSPELARRLEVPVVELNPSQPFSAGRGRNEGLAEARRQWPHIAYILFLDGDCVLDARFPREAVTVFENDPHCAIVTGHLSERFPERSVYNRLCQIEWRSPPGRITDLNRLGGIMAVRISAFLAVGGFDLMAIAGEEPDLGARLLMADYSIIKIDRAMATHDAQMTNFSQWWIRAVRGGHALAHRYFTHGRTKLRDGRRAMLSALFWGLGLPAGMLLLLWPTRGLSLLAVGSYVVLGLRVYRYYRSTGLIASDAGLVARFIVYSKFADVIGIMRYGLNRFRGRFEIIEYK